MNRKVFLSALAFCSICKSMHLGPVLKKHGNLLNGTQINFFCVRLLSLSVGYDFHMDARAETMPKKNGLLVHN